MVLQALLCLGALAEGAAHRQAPHGMREALAHESTAPLLGYLLSLMLQVQGASLLLLAVPAPQK